jgi:hypothetical protein
VLPKPQWFPSLVHSNRMNHLDTILLALFTWTDTAAHHQGAACHDVPKICDDDRTACCNLVTHFSRIAPSPNAVFGGVPKTSHGLRRIRSSHGGFVHITGSAWNPVPVPFQPVSWVDVSVTGAETVAVYRPVPVHGASLPPNSPVCDVGSSP